MRHRLNNAFAAKQFFKAISGIDIFDQERVLSLTYAVDGLADAIDVAADRHLVTAVREAAPKLIVFASSTDPVQLARSGADVLELGNYDALYRSGIYPSATQVLIWARAVMAATDRVVPFCATVPGHLPREEQVALAIELQAEGVHMLQTEGILGPRGQGVAGSIIHLLEALANTTAIRHAVKLPLLLAGGVDPQNTPHAIAAGADGVGVGRFLKEARSVQEVRQAAHEIRRALAERPITVASL